MTLKKCFATLLLCIIGNLIYAQGEANNWYFGRNAGITFNTNPPTALLDGELNTEEGCSSISDSSGNLLFYTDGRTVWDSEHTIMPNADYFNNTGLNGDPSSTHSGLIVPHPTEPNLFYVFTVDEPHHENAFAYPNQGPALPNGAPTSNYQDVQSHTVPQDDDGFNNGFNYSVIDMNLRNGLGDVIDGQRNNHLVTYDENDPEEIKYKCSEKVTAVIGSDCNSIWVITHFIDTFYAFQITEDGVDETPVTSQVGPEAPISSYRRSAIGSIKASPDGEKLIVATSTTNYNQEGAQDSGDGNVFLYDFDATSGEINNPTTLINNVSAFGVEFSPDSQKAYASVNDNGGSDLYQWDLTSDFIQNSISEVPGYGSVTATGIQIGPDGRLYVSKINQDYLGVLTNPNEEASNLIYTENVFQGAVSLEGQEAAFGLPPFIQSIFTSRINIVDDENQEEIETDLRLCEDESYTLGYEYEEDENATYTWFLNGEELEDETDPFISVEIDNQEVPIELTYTLEIQPENDCKLSGIANLRFYPYPELQETTLFACANADSQISGEFNLENAIEDIFINENDFENNEYEISFHTNLTDAENNLNEITNTTNFEPENETEIWVRVTSTDGECSSFTSIELINDDVEVVENQLQTCDDAEDGFQFFDLENFAENSEYEITAFYQNESDALNETNPITDEANYENNTAYNDAVFYRAEGDADCGILGIIDLEIIDLPTVENDTDIIYCREQYPTPISISAGNFASETSNYSFEWSPGGETTSEIEVNEIGSYSVIITDEETGCQNIRNINLIPSNRATFSVNVSDGSQSNSIEIVVSDLSEGEYEFAFDSPYGPYQDNPIFNDIQPGIYDVYVRDKNGCGIVRRTVNVVGVMPFFTPNNDGINDTWRLVGVQNSENENADVMVFDRYGKLLAKFKGASAGWDGTYKGNPMPNDDYWYRVVLNDGRSIKGHFTLKR
ncbi:MAG: T9SS type B sorting domain-containing protein [Bacteroidota bacterium]